MIHTTMTPAIIDQATIDRAIARGSRERSRAIRAFFAGLFRSTAPKAAPASGTHATA